MVISIVMRIYFLMLLIYTSCSNEYHQQQESDQFYETQNDIQNEIQGEQHEEEEEDSNVPFSFVGISEEEEIYRLLPREEENEDFGISPFDDDYSTPSSNEVKASLNIPFSLVGIDKDKLDKFAKISQSVVEVISRKNRFHWYKPWESQNNVISAGTAFWAKIGNVGYFVTNAHVVHNAISTIIKVPRHGNSKFDVTVAGICFRKDLALLSLKNPKEFFKINKLDPLEFGDSDTFQRGSAAIGIGFPLGQSGLKITSGIVSGFQHAGGRYFIQITTPINHGNSGGPLLNNLGEVMGINSAAILRASNVGYSIPSNSMKYVLEAIAPSKEVKSSFSQPILTLAERIYHFFPYFGAKLSSTSRQFMDYMGVPKGVTGVYVGRVHYGGFFRHAKVRPGDIILKFNGHVIDNFGHTTIKTKDARTSQRMNIYDLGERIKRDSIVNVVVWRKKRLTLEGTFRYRKYHSRSRIRYVREAIREQVDYEVFGGMVLMQLTYNHVRRFMRRSCDTRSYWYSPRFRRHSHVVVSALMYPMTVVPEGAFRMGDIIQLADGIPVRTLSDFRKNLCFKATLKNPCTFKSIGGALVVMDFAKTLSKEERIAKLNGYDLTEGTKNALHRLKTLSKKSEKIETDD